MGGVRRFLKACSLLAIVSIIQPASGYEFRITNAVKVKKTVVDAAGAKSVKHVGEDIAIEVYGIPFGSMMRGFFGKSGLFPTQKYWEKDFGNTKTINNAGHLSGPYIIPYGHTIVFRFTNLDIGVCFDLSQLQVGRSSNGYNMTPAQVVALPNQWYDSIFGATQQAGDAVQNIGKAVGEIGSVVPDPRAQAVIQGVSAGTVAVGALTDVIGKLVRSGSCKAMSFVAVEGKNGFSVDLLTRQQ